MKVTDDAGALGHHHSLHHHQQRAMAGGGLATKRASNRKRLCIGAAIAVIVGEDCNRRGNDFRPRRALLGLVVIAVCVGAYFRLQARKREVHDLHAYMRQLVKDVNSSPTSRWKVRRAIGRHSDSGERRKTSVFSGRLQSFRHEKRQRQRS